MKKENDDVDNFRNGMYVIWWIGLCVSLLLCVLG